ncbi:MAG: TetR/AcrR family transcriptional regulator [candidate division Zixibacteria bacterium]|nr:TetR/AcrR family transcriptional regulator [candidate division Zixibacteria bacterium]
MIAADTSKDNDSGNKKQTRHGRRFDRTRAKLLKAGRTVVAEKGLDRATVDDITVRADVGRGTFYYHFNDMGELIGDLMKEVLSELAGQIQDRCQVQPDLVSLLDAMIGAHIEFFSKRWEDFVLFYQGRADLTLVDGYDGIETPFVDYLKVIEGLIDSAISQPIPRPVLRRLACAIAGFISGYYSFAVITSSQEDVDKTFMSLRSAFVASLARFISEALPDTRTERH